MRRRVIELENGELAFVEDEQSNQLIISGTKSETEVDAETWKLVQKNKDNRVKVRKIIGDKQS